MKWACTTRNWHNVAVSGNQKTKLQSYPNSVFFPSNNEKRKTQAQRNLLKRKRPQPEHKAPKHHVEVGINDLHRNTATYIPVNRGSLHPPRRSGSPWVDEVESRGWGRRAPQSPSSSSFGAPQGNNKIYTYDVVFRIGEANTNDIRTTSIPYKITKDISQPQVTAPIRRPQVTNIGRGTGPAYNDSSAARPSKRLCVTKNRHNTVFATTLGPKRPGEIDPIASTTAAPAMLMT